MISARCWSALLWAIALAIGLDEPALAQGTLAEPQAKAAFVLNFARYIEWPERTFTSRASPLLICLLGRDSIGGALMALQNRQVQGRPVAVRLLNGIDETGPCQVLYIGASEARRLTLVLRALAGQAVLTVSDTDGFIDVGGAIGIVQGDGRLQFEVNRDSLEQAQLRASSHLLKLARNLANQKGKN
ncbi:MAG: YfiR family protein [Candidatus Accumulibacter phosphatis]|nr:YfiR family protein [Candidatus Accumulibacter phosphatis]